MFHKLAQTFQPKNPDFDAISSATQFNRRPQRLRELKPEGLLEDLPPAFKQETASCQRAEAIEQVLSSSEPGGQQTQKPDAATPSPEKALDRAPPDLAPPDRASAARQLLLQKSGIRIEKIKDIQSSLERLQQQFQAKLPLPSQPGHEGTYSLLLGIPQQLSAAYMGRTALAEQEGLSVVRPWLQKQAQKITSLGQNDAEMLDKVLLAEAKVWEKLKESTPLPPLEKAALLALAETLNQVLKLVLPAQDANSGEQSESITTSGELSGDPLAEAGEWLEPHQIEAKLFQLRNRLPQTPESERAALRRQIDTLEQQLEQHHSRQELQMLQRSLRTLKAMRDQLRRQEQQIDDIGDAALFQGLRTGCHQLRQQTRKELQQLQESYQKVESGRKGQPALALLALQEQKWSRLDREDFQNCLQALEAREQQLLAQFESGSPQAEILRQWAGCFSELLSGLTGLLPLLARQSEALKLEQALTALTRAEAGWPAVLDQLEDLETRLLATGNAQESDSCFEQMKSLYFETMGQILS
ncbi:MAG: hypothetical protein ACAI44_38260 [Candidatus Sericytochromatia bacterium]